MTTNRVTAAELRAFIERWEREEQVKKEAAEGQREIMSEAKGQGYCVKTMKQIIALRKKTPGDIAEEEAILDLYKEALGM